MAEILCELEETKESEQIQESKIQGLMYDQKNADFLNKEISFLIDNLRKVSIHNIKVIQKATDSGLGEDSLMPLVD